MHPKGTQAPTHLWKYKCSNSPCRDLLVGQARLARVANSAASSRGAVKSAGLISGFRACVSNIRCVANVTCRLVASQLVCMNVLTSEAWWSAIPKVPHTSIDTPATKPTAGLSFGGTPANAARSVKRRRSARLSSLRGQHSPPSARHTPRGSRRSRAGTKFRRVRAARRPRAARRCCESTCFASGGVT